MMKKQVAKWVPETRSSDGGLPASEVWPELPGQGHKRKNSKAHNWPSCSHYLSLLAGAWDSRPTISDLSHRLSGLWQGMWASM